MNNMMTKSDNILDSDNADNNGNVKCLGNQLSGESEPLFLIATQTFFTNIPPQRNILLSTSENMPRIFQNFICPM